VREVIYFKRVVYVRALQELGEQAFTAGRRTSRWLTDESCVRRTRGRPAPPADGNGSGGCGR